MEMIFLQSADTSTGRATWLARHEDVTKAVRKTVREVQKPAWARRKMPGNTLTLARLDCRNATGIFTCL